MRLASGSTIGSYRVLHALGEGGMGVVYAALDERSGRRVALKVASLAVSADEEFMLRFRREGRAAAKVSHENVVPLLEAGEENGLPYIAFELLPGGTLHDLLRRRSRLEWREAAVLGVGIARGLAAVHEAGLVHRDLKPENVLLDEKGEPKVSDFGLVGAQAASLALTEGLTKTGDVLGTLSYMAPEQTQGSRDLSPSADLYSLGAVLYALLTGGPPHRGSGAELIEKHLREEPRSPREVSPDVPPRLERLVLDLLAKKPGERPASAKVVARELAAIARSREGGFPWKLVPGLALAVLLLAVGTWLVRAANRRSEAWRLAASAASLVEKRRYDEAIAESAKAIELDGDVALAWSVRGRAHEGKREDDLAMADLARALELDARDAPAWRERGVARERRGDLDGAIADASRAIELDPRDAGAFLLRATARARKRDGDGAIADATRSIELDPRCALAHSKRATWRAGRGEGDLAIADASRAIELDPRDAVAWRCRGEEREKKGDLDGAIADASRALELDPRGALAWLNRGFARERRGDTDGALADLTKSIEFDMTNAFAWTTRASLRNQKRDVEGVIADLTRALELDPKNGFAWRQRGTTRLVKDDLVGAISDLSRAIEIDAGDATSFQYRGVARRTKGDYDGAIADLERFLVLAPDHKNAKGIRSAIDQMRSQGAGGGRPR